MNFLLDSKIWIDILIWVVVFVAARYLLPKIQNKFTKQITPLMVTMPVSFILSDRIISDAFYFSYLMYFVLIWLIIGLILFVVSVRVVGKTTIQQFWMTYLNASTMISIVLLILSMILWVYRIITG